MSFLKILTYAFFIVFSASSVFAQNADTMVLELKSGQVKIQLLPDVAPKHVDRIKTLAYKVFYDGL